MDRPQGFSPRDPSLMARRTQLVRYMRRVGPGLVEVERKIPYSLRAPIWLILMLYVAIILLDTSERNFYSAALREAFAYEDVLRERYVDYEAMRARAEARNVQYREEFGPFADPLISKGWVQSFEEYAQHQQAFRRLGMDLLVLGFPILLFLGASLVPRLSPLRVDGARGMIYLWWRGELYVALLGYKTETLPPYLQSRPVGMVTSTRAITEFRPLDVTLYAVDGSGRQKKTRLGVSPAAGFDPWYDIERGIMDVIAHQGEDPGWLSRDLPKGFHWTDPFRWLFGFTLIPRRRHDEERTYQAIAKFMAAHPPARGHMRTDWWGGSGANRRFDMFGQGRA